MDFEPAYSRYPLASVNQRLGALIVDFLSCWFISELTLSLLSVTSSNPLRLFTFVVTWFVFRVFISARSQGQSFGRWLMSIRVIDAEYGKTATIGAFIKREALVFICSIFLIETITSTFIVFAWIPFAADAAFAIVDEEKRQAFHDRISSTISIQTRKGFQIDQKLGKLFNQAGEQASKLYQSRQDRDVYADEYPTPRKPKRRPRTKSRPPQDFYPEDDYSYRDSGRDSQNPLDDGFGQVDDFEQDNFYQPDYQSDYQDRPNRSDRANKANRGDRYSASSDNQERWDQNFGNDPEDEWGMPKSERSLSRPRPSSDDSQQQPPKRSARRPRRR